MNGILIFILISLFGILLVRLLIKDISIIESGALGFLVGFGITTFLFFVLSWLGLKITYDSIFKIILVMTLILSIFGWKRLKIQKLKIDLNMFEKIIVLIIICVLLIGLLLSVYYPITAWDALALYDFRSKVIADSGYFVQVANQFIYFSHYPLFTSMAHVFLYLSGVNNPQFIYSLYFISFTIIYYLISLNFVKRSIALVSTLVIISIPEIFEHSTIAYTNLPYTIFYVLGILYLHYSFINKRNDYFLLSGIMVGLSTWVRADLPFWITGVIFVIIFSIKSRNIKPFFLYLIPFLIIQQTWNYFASGIFGNDYSTVGQISSATNSILNLNSLNRIYEVLVYLYTNVFLNWKYISILFIISVLVNLRNKFNERTGILLMIIIVNLLGLFVGTYIFSFKFPEWREIADSASRMSMFFPLLMIYYISLVVDLDLNKKQT